MRTVGAGADGVAVSGAGPQRAHQRERVRRPDDAAGESGAASGTVQAPPAASPSLVCAAHRRALRHAPGLFFSGSRRRSRLLADPLRRGWRARWRGLHSHPPLARGVRPDGTGSMSRRLLSTLAPTRSQAPLWRRMYRASRAPQPRGEHVAQRIADILRNRSSEEVGTCRSAKSTVTCLRSPSSAAFELMIRSARCLGV